MQFCGWGVPVACQYKYAKKRSDESFFDYICQLYMIALRVKLKINGGPHRDQKELVENYIDTLDD